jgi:hypothetical protein
VPDLKIADWAAGVVKDRCCGFNFHYNKLG